MQINKQNVDSFLTAHGTTVTVVVFGLIGIYMYPMFGMLIIWIAFRQIRLHYEGKEKTDDRNTNT